MRILIANKFYYNRGGDCIASMALEKLLKDKGHDVAFFSMQYAQNFESEWESYFPSEVCFQTSGWKGKAKALTRILSSKEVRRKFTSLLDQFKPDVVHLNNIHSQLSPIIGEIAHRRNIKVVWTMHDYKLICPNYKCLHNGKVCSLCVKDRNPIHVLKTKCMKGSFAASTMAYLEALVWNANRLERNTDCFIAPSHFLADLMIKGGFPSDKINVVPNFINHELPSGLPEKEDYYVYIGRLSEEKGLHTLLQVAESLPYELHIVGDGPLKGMLPNCSSHIQFLGFKNWNQLVPIAQKAKFLVVPSEWYEVIGLSNIEAQCLGTPVLGADIGGIPETIDVPSCGMLFEAGNKIDLEDKIKLMFERSFNYKRIADVARERFSADNYYKEIIKIYEQ